MISDRVATEKIAAMRVNQKKKNIFQYRLRNMDSHLSVNDILIPNTTYGFNAGFIAYERP